MSINKKEIFRNILYAFSAQGLSLCVSVIMSLIIPKILDVTAFGFWQLFIFYTSYGGILAFGWNDGIYLRIGGKRYCDLDFKLIGSQYKLSIYLQLIICVILISFFQIFSDIDLERRKIILFSLISILIINTSAMLGYIFQAVNQTKKYSWSIIIEKIIFITLLIIFLITKDKSYEHYIVAYIAARFVALLYCLVNCKEIVFSSISKNYSTVLNEYKRNVQVGLILTCSNLSSMIILGIGRFLIDNNWGIETFGKVSFAIMMTNFCLLFINQLSIVLFPILRTCSAEESKLIYIKLKTYVEGIIPFVLLLYIPAYFIIKLWLPKYEECLFYLIILLPICAYDGKMQLLYNTYFKVLRKERILLYINIAAATLSVSLCLIGTFILQNIVVIVAFMLIAIAFRSFIAELYLSKIYFCTNLCNMFYEFILTISFIILNIAFSLELAIVLYMIIMFVYFLHNKQYIYAFRQFFITK